jgi:tRNA (guanine10-N2)-methyltransferase
MPIPDFLAMDISALQFNMLETEQGIPLRPIFDSIVCDPPYGVRARSKKAGVPDSKKHRPKREALDTDQPYYGQKEQFDFIELHDHLLNVAAKLLKPGGRLVFLFHTDEEQPPEKNKFPEHPSLQFIRSSRDKLTKVRARHLITMVKKLVK